MIYTAEIPTLIPVSHKVRQKVNACRVSMLSKVLFQIGSVSDFSAYQVQTI